MICGWQTRNMPSRYHLFSHSSLPVAGSKASRPWSLTHQDLLVAGDLQQVRRAVAVRALGRRSTGFAGRGVIGEDAAFLSSWLAFFAVSFVGFSAFSFVFGGSSRR